MTTVPSAEKKPFFVTSDLHLGAVTARTDNDFRDFLDYAATASAGLLINGDLFEFGIAYRSVVPRKHVRVLAKLADVVELGLPVYFLAGNHDYLEWGGHVLQDDVGIILLADPVVMEVTGRRALITHGDVAGAGALRSRLERRLARNRAFVGLLRWLHPDLAARLQPLTTTTRRQVRLHSEGQGGGPKVRAPAIESWARSLLRKDPSLDLVIAAHAHLPARIEIEPGRYYLNPGDWITHCTYLIVPESGAPEIRRWPVDHA